MQGNYSIPIATGGLLGLMVGIIAGITVGAARAESPRTTIQLPDNWVVTEAPDSARIETAQERDAARPAHIPVQDVIRRFEEEYGGQVIEVELDRRVDLDVYKIKLVDTGGAERNIEIDARSGEVLREPGTGAAARARGEHIPMRDVISRFEDEYNGRVIEIELDREDTHDEYEIELIDDRGVKWKIDVDAHSGEILKRERDKRVAATPDSRVFAEHIPMQEIISRLEAEFNGRVVEIELERESYHDEYEVELIDAQGVKWKIDVDAHSGEILKRKRD